MHNQSSRQQYLPVFIGLALFWLAFSARGQALAFETSPPPLAATSYILLDYDSGEVLVEQNADMQAAPASLTKLMTAYIVFSELKAGRLTLTDKIVVSQKARDMGGSRMFLEVGSTVSLEELLKGMIVQSGNDATVVLAEHVAGSEAGFATLMNQYADKLGLKNTRYANSSGMPAEMHHTTAKDMAKMARALIRDFPDYYPLYSEKEYTYNKIRQLNRNLLLWRDESVDGVKTGYTEEAGYCLVASAKRENMRLISAVMGTESKEARAEESRKLLNYGFRFFETHRLYQAKSVLQHAEVWQGAADTIGLGLAKPLFITIPRGEYDNLKAVLHVNKPLIAPLAAGHMYGRLEVSLNSKPVANRPLVALSSVGEGDFFRQMVDYLLLKLE
ncbi:MAG: D-alanyl-D-alanine carboxypeptidase family protein [Pseudomonadota bacterium]